MFYGNPKNLASWSSFLLMLGLSGFLMGCSPPPQSLEEIPPSSLAQVPTEGQMLPISAIAQLGGQDIELEVARTPQEQAIGLMFRDEMPDNRGMLFIFSSAQRVNFWMKNVSIPLDMLFLRDGTIQAIARNVPPCLQAPCPTYGPNLDIDQVIELRGGRAAELGVQVGDRVSIDFLDETPSEQQ
ncbi:DUF192 domain-containing protein [Spirulina subsalsa FACHB-351]|uniref:DUF192 domain-containing protein n=1 Tax=Spirulina subsalsa FACHB-351 TaxID=234711 RepID=A0ABT3L3R9_9CYAN|nr:DUF192 domain-containing protein [Spirulina subsalsa]MCW6035754.1 DUF192 domain-containing protein [Spirulina subsalsa FACHB-351]